MVRPRQVLIPAALAALLLTTAADATPYTFDVIVDLSAVPVEDVTLSGNPGNRIRFRAEFPEIDTFFVTDTLHLNISFADGASISLVDSGAPFLVDNERIVGRTVVHGFRASDRHDVYQFIGVGGSLLVNPLIADNNFENDVNLTNTAFRFSGLVLDLTFSNPDFDPDVPILEGFIGFSFEFWADSISVEGLSDVTVPEPSTIAMLALGLAAWARGRVKRRRPGRP